MTNDKQPNALKTIGEVAELLGLPSYVIRFWEAKMPSLAPIKRQGRRYYSPANVELLGQMKDLLYKQGYTIKGAQQFLAARQTKSELPAALMAPRVVASEDLDVVQQILQQLRNTQQKLAAAIEQANVLSR